VKTKPKGLTVSAIIPIYNGARDLATAISSVLAQDVLPNELILVDDGSVDASLKVAAAALAGAPDGLAVTILSQSNAGQSAARNAAAAAATGELLAFLDQDDTWYPDHIRRLSERFVERPTLGLCYGDFDEIDDSGAYVVRGFRRAHVVRHPRSSIVEWIATDTMVLPTASIVRASAFQQVGGFDADLIGYEDDELWIRLFRAGWTSSYLPRSLSAFRVHAGSSSRRATFRESRVTFLRRVAAALPDSPELRRYYVSDLLLPRLLRSALDDYLAELRMHRPAEARAVAQSIDELLAGTGSRYLSKGERRLLHRPSLARVVLRLRRALVTPIDKRLDLQFRMSRAGSGRL
jgi:glycosyltransferase involved in cell wall biosynthesis